MSVPVVVGVIAGSIIISAPIIIVSDQIVQRQAAARTADASALAAADALLGWINEEPCALAARVAELSGFELVSCDLGLADVSVSIRIDVLGKEIGARAGSDL